MIRLWAPTGTFRLRHGPFGEFDTETTVKSVAGKVIRIDVELQQIQLTIDMPENNYLEQKPEYYYLPLWTLQKRSGSGIWQPIEVIKRSRAFLLDKSMYRLVPYTGDENKIIKVDLTLGEDIAVRLPEIALPKFGSALLKFDVSILEDDYVELYANYSILQSSGTEGLWAPNEPVGISVKVVPDGIRIDGVLLGVEIAVQCKMITSSAADAPKFILNPIRIKLTKTASGLDVEVIELVYMGEGWRDHPLVLVTDIPGVYVDLKYWWGRIPSGEREFGVIDDGQLILRRKFNIPADGEDSGPLPEDYLRKLEAHKLKK